MRKSREELEPVDCYIPDVPEFNCKCKCEAEAGRGPILISLMGFYLTPPGMIADDTTTPANRWTRIHVYEFVGAWKEDDSLNTSMYRVNR